jgi:WD40 repeat protein
MLQGRSVAELERGYLAALEWVKDWPKGGGGEKAARLRAYEAFVRKHSHHLARHPAALLALAHAQALDSPVLADARQRFHDGPDRPWLRLLHPPATDRNPALLRTIDVGSEVWAVACLEIGRVPHALSGSADGIVRLWDLVNGECVQEFRGHNRRVGAVAVTADGRAVSASADETLRVWDLDSGACAGTLEGHTGWVRAVALTADGRAVSASRDGTLRVWDLGTGACARTLAGHTSGVRAVALAADGRAVSASHDGTVRVWDLGTGACAGTLEGHTGWVLAVALTADGRAVSASHDGTLRLWDLGSGLCLAVFPWDYPFTAVVVTPHPPYTAVAGDVQGNVLFFRLENLDRA